MQCGARFVGELDNSNDLDVNARQLLQGFGSVKWPTDINNAQRRAMIAREMPPPFAEALSKCAFVYQTMPGTRDKLLQQMAVVYNATDEYAHAYTTCAVDHTLAHNPQPPSFIEREDTLYPSVEGVGGIGDSLDEHTHAYAMRASKQVPLEDAACFGKEARRSG